MIPEWLLAFALTLFVLDIFVATEALTWVALTVLALYFTCLIGPSIWWGILVYLIILSILVLVYYFVVRKFVGDVVQKVLLRNAPKEVMERIVGERVQVKIVKNVIFVSWNDELWNVGNATELDLCDGEMVVVKEVKGGVVTVKRG